MAVARRPKLTRLRRAARGRAGAERGLRTRQVRCRTPTSSPRLRENAGVVPDLARSDETQRRHRELRLAPSELHRSSSPAAA
jgi:hypothetical protein